MQSLQVKPIAHFLRRRGTVPDFRAVADPRARRGQRWTSQSLFSAVFIAMVAMQRTLRDMERLTARLSGCRRYLGIGRRVPDSTVAAFLARVTDEEGLRECLVRQMRDAERRKALEPVRLPLNVIAIDGKTIWCGPKPVDDPACQAMSQDDGRTYYRLHTLHAVLVSAASQPCIDQMLVPAETNETGAFEEFFTRLVKTYGRSRRLELFTFDAAFSYHHQASVVADAKCAYVMAVKDNQPTLLQEAERLCGWGTHKQVGYRYEAATEWERYQGKSVRRELYRSRDIERWPDWESARQVWRVKQTTMHDDGTSEVENRYFVTNLAWGKLSGRQILAVIRAHWGVENGCHWTLDVAMHEDTHPWCKQGQALRMLSWLRLMAYNALRFLRDRYLRSAAGHALPWLNLAMDIVLALCTPQAWRTIPRAKVDDRDV
jgi:predicted transposase YbfD/YdcC